MRYRERYFWDVVVVFEITMQYDDPEQSAASLTTSHICSNKISPPFQEISH